MHRPAVSLRLWWAVFALAGLAACSSQQLYGAGQGWQRHECQKINDLQTRQRCLAQADLPQNRYDAQAEAARRSPPDAKPPDAK